MASIADPGVAMIRLFPVVALGLLAALPSPAPTGKSRLFATSANQGIVEVDPTDGSLLNTFAAPTSQGVNDGLAFDGVDLWYISGSQKPNTLYRIDPNTGAVKKTLTLPNNSFRDGLAALNGKIWVSHFSAIEQDLVAYDPDTGAVVDTIDLDAINPGLFFAGGLGALRDPDFLLVPDAVGTLIYLVNLDTGLPFAFDGQLAGDNGLAGIGNEIFVSVNTGLTDQITVFDTSGAVRRKLTVAGSIGLQSLAGATAYAPGRLGAFIDGTWFLDRNGNTEFNPGTDVVGWGSAGDTPVRGDWNGDGYLEVGVFNGGVWFLDVNGDRSLDAATEVKGWGAAGWKPMPGDWNGDGITDLGVVTPELTWFLDLNGDGVVDPATEIVGWGSTGDTPVVGDWDGDGADSVGVFSGGQWYLDINGDRGFNPATEIKGWGAAGWTPMPGDWNKDGVTDLGVVTPGMTWFLDLNGDFAFDAATEIVGWGSPGDTPVVGDWDGDGRDAVGVFKNGQWFLDINGDRAFDPSTDSLGWGVPGSIPVAGGWR
jgi:hypothetical protein